MADITGLDKADWGPYLDVGPGAGLLVRVGDARSTCTNAAEPEA
jgi:hypothetical protein